jgi:Sulfotransferase domain
MELLVVGAGVGRTGTHSLKLALEQLLDAPCHHMLEIISDPSQRPRWTDAIEGRPVDWSAMLAPYRATIDWPSSAFWRELAAANPNALVLLSVRDPEAWYRSASSTVFATYDNEPAELRPWLDTFRKLLRERFCDRFDDPAAMMDAFVRHNDSVRAEVAPDRLLEWTPSDGWEPICDRLGLPVPTEPFPVTNSTEEFRAMKGMQPLT